VPARQKAGESQGRTGCWSWARRARADARQAFSAWRRTQPWAARGGRRTRPMRPSARASRNSWRRSTGWLPLPALRDGRLGKVAIDYHVEFDHHFYSVPCDISRTSTSAAGVVEVFEGGRVATSARQARRLRSSAHARGHRAHEWTLGAAPPGPGAPAPAPWSLACSPAPPSRRFGPVWVYRLADHYQAARGGLPAHLRPDELQGRQGVLDAGLWTPRPPRHLPAAAAHASIAAPATTEAHAHQPLPTN
jgi:hypothetical protein